MKHKLNKNLLLKEKGFTWHNRYSSSENTDDIGRWARIGYYNGIQIAWINGLVKQDKMPIIENARGTFGAGRRSRPLSRPSGFIQTASACVTARQRPRESLRLHLALQ